MASIPERPQSESSNAADGEILNEAQSLRAELSERDARLARLLTDFNRLKKDHENLKLAFDGVLSSHSWKLTAPLRLALRLRRKLWPLLRFQRLSLTATPVNALAPVGPDSYKITGSTPYLALNPVRGALSGGFALFSGRLASEKPHMFMTFYWEGASGYGILERLMLPFPTGEHACHLVKLPSDVKSLRIDPFDGEGTFGLSELSLQPLGSLQVALFLLKKHFAPVITDPERMLRKVWKAVSILRTGGFGALRAKLFADSYSANYEEWVRRFDTLTDKDREKIRSKVDNLRQNPLISVLMPTFNTPADCLRRAIESVIKQLYPNWELCIADDASTDPQVKLILEEYKALDSRIKVTYRQENGHISKASQSALELASGEYLALLDHDDELTEDALYQVVEEIGAHPDANLIYSDEDKIDRFGNRLNPYFKSDLNIEMLRVQNFICHLAVYKTELVRKLGGFREGVEGAQDWDLVLRVIDASAEGQVRHIPHILYHWRIIEGSTAQNTAGKPYVMKAQVRAVSDHLARRGLGQAKVEILEDISQLRVHYALPSPLPLVSIIMPTKDQAKLLRRCLQSILKLTTYKNYEILLVDNGSQEEDTFTLFKEFESDSRIRVIRDDSPFNYSRINNQATKLARGEIFAFLNNDLQVISPEWLSQMVSHVVQPDVGVVGAKLYFPNDAIQHAGVILGIGGVAGHSHKGRPRSDVGYWNRLVIPQNLSAVTAACAVVRKEVFEAVEGFEERELSVAFNDVDLCLRIRQKGYLVVYTPYAELYHYESASRGYENTPEKFRRFEQEIENMKRRWARKLEHDPYYNPNLTLISEDFAYAFPPRARKPWRE